MVLLSIELNPHKTMKNNYNRWKQGLKSSESHDAVPFEQSTTQNSTGALPVYTQCCISESNTKALHTLLHTDLHSFQSADCFLCCTQEPIGSGGGDEAANSNPHTDNMPMVSIFFSFSGRQMQTLCRMALSALNTVDCSYSLVVRMDLFFKNNQNVCFLK